MVSQSRIERDEFFRSLSQLDEVSDTDTEENVTSTSHKRAQRLQPSAADTGRRTRQLAAKPGLRPALEKAASSPQAPAVLTSSLDSFSSQSSKAAGTKLKRTQSDIIPTSSSSKRKKKGQKVANEPVVIAQCFPETMRFLFIPNIGLTRLQQTQIDDAERHGARIASAFDVGVTHIIADSTWTVDQILNNLPDRRQPEGVPIVSWNWIVQSIIQGLQNPHQHRFSIKGLDSYNGPAEARSVRNKTSSVSGTTKARRRKDLQTTPQKCHEVEEETIPPPPEIKSLRLAPDDELDLLQKDMDKRVPAIEDIVGSDPSFNFEGNYVFDTTAGTGKGGSFSCMNKNEREQGSNNPNYPAIVLLRQMAEVYAANTGDQFRARAFKQAATTLTRQETLIATKEEAEQLPNIGSSIAEKIEEIARKGRLGRLDEVNSDPKYCARNLFSRIYAVGHAQAAAWVAAGHQTLEDLLQNVVLTPNQRIGIEHFEDFETRIPRAEVLQHGRIIDKTLKEIDSSLEIIIGGSYRRGSESSGDIDVLITKKGAGMDQIQSVVMQSLIPQLQEQGFIKAELASGHFSDKGKPSKWMGACVLPGKSVWRRLDLLFVPWDELGAALIYWTGNDFFNRSVRLLASRKGMRLNQHGLYKNILRGKNRVKVTEGELVESRSEEKIFEILGVAYRPPAHRNP